MSDEMVAFLKARLNEDEQAARAAALAVGDTGYEHGELVRAPALHGDALVADGQHWAASHNQVTRHQSRGPERVVAEASAFGGRPVAQHIARHDPRRVLAEVAAKRRILGRINSHAAVMGEDEVHRDILRLLAAVYDSHPDYRQEWRP